MYPVKYFLNTDYQEMEVLGVTGLFSNLRVERESLPEGFYKYSLREGDNDFFSTVEKAVMINHAGDFICKSELPLGEKGFKDLGEDYGFTDEPVDLDMFFGVDTKLMVAEALDTFMRDFDPHGYADNLPTGVAISEGNMVDDIRAMLEDREQTEGILVELKEIYEEGKGSFDDETGSLLTSLISKVDDLCRAFPEKRAELFEQIQSAETLKEKSLDDNGQLEPEVDAP